jgi:hypothetical protein
MILVETSTYIENGALESYVALEGNRLNLQIIRCTCHLLLDNRSCIQNSL